MPGKRPHDSLAHPRASQPYTKAQKRPAKEKPANDGSSKKLRKLPNKQMRPATQLPPPPPQQPNAVGSFAPPLPEAANLCFDGALELDGWYCGAVDEEKLLGWFPFADEDFSCCWSDTRPASSLFFWEDYHDIWHLKHIQEIPGSENR